MDARTEQIANRRPTIDPGPLPREFEAELRRIDDLLARGAMPIVTPVGLIDRVFTASARLLPVPLVNAGGDRRLRLAGAGDLPRHHRRAVTASSWGRLALAASVALAFVMAGRFIAVQVGGESPILVQRPHSLERLAVLRAPADSRNLEQYLMNGHGELQLTELDYLLVTNDTTFSDLAAELQVLAGDL
jgi:hypothetical protein